VPTKEDFCSLEKILMNKASCSGYNTNTVAPYLGAWGAEFGAGALNDESAFYYRTADACGETCAYVLAYYQNIVQVGGYHKQQIYAVRCVQD
jgi:hypothetical protein